MRCDSHDPIEPGCDPEAEVPPAEHPLDAAESTWDPWLWALYLGELASEQRSGLH